MIHPDVSHQLRLAGPYVTRPRESVLEGRAELEWLAEHPHNRADQIGAGIVQRVGSVSIQTVYNVLAAFTGDNHHHLVCPTCYAAAAVSGDDDEQGSFHHEEAR